MKTKSVQKFTQTFTLFAELLRRKAIHFRFRAFLPVFQFFALIIGAQSPNVTQTKRESFRELKRRQKERKLETICSEMPLLSGNSKRFWSKSSQKHNKKHEKRRNSRNARIVVVLSTDCEWRDVKCDPKRNDVISTKTPQKSAKWRLVALSSFSPLFRIS